MVGQNDKKYVRPFYGGAIWKKKTASSSGMVSLLTNRMVRSVGGYNGRIRLFWPTIENGLKITSVAANATGRVQPGGFTGETCL